MPRPPKTTSASTTCPTITGDHSHMNTVADMADGMVKGYFVMGENPVVGTVNGPLQRKGLRALDWLVVRDFQLTETAEFWREAPEIERGEVRPGGHRHGSLLLPRRRAHRKGRQLHQYAAAAAMASQGDRAAGRLPQRAGFHFQTRAAAEEAYAGSSDPKDRPIRDLTWDYPTKGATQEPDAEAVLREINGYTVADRQAGGRIHRPQGRRLHGLRLLDLFRLLSRTASIRRRAASRTGSRTGWRPEWAWAWPHNRRLLYNRASADPEGKPWSERKAYVWWDEAQAEVDRPRRAGFRPTSRLPTGLPKDARGKETISGVDPFIMQADGKGWLFVPSGLQDGPLPTHYEPQESVMRNPLYGQQCNPARMEWMRPKDNPYHQPYDDPRFPYLSDHLPADRASHGRRHVALAALALRIAAGSVLRSVAGTGRRSAD